MLQHQSKKPPTLKEASGGKIFPEKLEEVLAKALAKAPMDRYQNMESLSKDLTAVLAREEAPPQANKGIPVWVLASAIVLVFVPLALVILWLNAKNQHIYDNHPATAATTGDAISRIDKSASKPAASAVLYSTVITREDGRRYRLFKFPSDAALGCFQIVGHKKSVVCQGEVQVPDDYSVTYIPGGKGLEQPEYLDRFRPDDLINVRLISIPMEAKATNTTLQHLSHITGILNLVLIDCDVDNNGVKYLSKFTHLQSMNIDLTPITSQALAHSPALKTLRSLYLHTSDSVTPVLESLKGSSNLEELYLHDDPLKPSDYKLIATMSHLRVLQADGCDAHNKDLETISVLPKLKYINFDRDYIDEDAIPTLKKMSAKGLQRAHLGSSSFMARNGARILKAIPQLHFE